MGQSRGRRISRTLSPLAIQNLSLRCPRAFPLLLVASGANQAMSRREYSVLELRQPVLAATFWREVEQVPERPDHVDVPRVLPVLLRREEHLGRIRMVDRTVP